MIGAFGRALRDLADLFAPFGPFAVPLTALVVAALVAIWCWLAIKILMPEKPPATRPIVFLRADFTAEGEFLGTSWWSAEESEEFAYEEHAADDDERPGEEVRVDQEEGGAERERAEASEDGDDLAPAAVVPRTAQDDDTERDDAEARR